MKKVLRTAMKRRTMMDVSVEDLQKLQTKVIAIDADNTACFDGTHTPLPGAEKWIQSMKQAGYRLVIVSNAWASRSADLGKRFGIPTIGTALKPFPFGFWRACLKMRVLPKHMTMIGDQVLTDAIGANLAGVNMLYVFPYEMEKRSPKIFAMKRNLEELIFTVQELLDDLRTNRPTGKE